MENRSVKLKEYWKNEVMEKAHESIPPFLGKTGWKARWFSDIQAGFFVLPKKIKPIGLGKRKFGDPSPPIGSEVERFFNGPFNLFIL